jgi:AraC family L-rhamnose operon transcriptional activator RhaR/AraC family L-rhamnose operon regulatory protein RhaS
MVRTLRKEDWFHPDGFPIVVARRDPQEPFGLHSHEFSEVVIITGGTGLHVTGRESWPLVAGDVFVIGGARPHDYQDMEGLRLINILFDPANLRMDALDLPSLPGYHALFTLEPAWRRRHQFKSRLHLQPKDLGTVIGIVDQLELELQVRSAGFSFIATALFMQLIGYLARCYSRSKSPDSRALLRLAEAISYLETNYAEEIDLDDLARKAHMSGRGFIRAFRAAMGSSPIAYLIQLRVNRAADMLRRGAQSITDIAFTVGFGDSNYFARQFRKLVGVSPRTYRQQHALTREHVRSLV